MKSIGQGLAILVLPKKFFFFILIKLSLKSENNLIFLDDQVCKSSKRLD